jgi:hypothetical protein
MGAQRKRPCRSQKGLLCKCIGDLYELCESGDALVGTQQGVECSILVVLPQEMSESFVVFAFDKDMITGLSHLSARAFYWLCGDKARVV